MTLDSIDNPITDMNTLNLHKISKISFFNTIKDRTDLVSNEDDFGQNFLYANYDGPLEEIPRVTINSAFNPKELESTDYQIMNKTTPSIYNDTFKLTGLNIEWDEVEGSNLSSINVYPGTYHLTVKPIPNISNCYFNPVITFNTSNPPTYEEVSEGSYTFTFSNTTSNDISFTMTITDSDNLARGYKSNNIYIAQKITVQAEDDSAQTRIDVANTLSITAQDEKVIVDVYAKQVIALIEDNNLTEMESAKEEMQSMITT